MPFDQLSRSLTFCACGHIWDEHDMKTCECQVFGCPCVYFEEDPEARNDVP